MAVSDHSQGYQCEFIDSVLESFYCNHCSLVARRLTLTSCCGESYCHACIIERQQQTMPCSCGQQLFTFIDAVKYQKQMRRLQVYCSMKERGCDWTGTLEQFDTHLDPDQDNCQYVNTKCPLNCQETIPKNKVEQHVAEECVKRDYICQYCAFKATYEEVVDTHLPECIYVPLKCPNDCGVSCERDFIEDHMRICRLEEVECEFSDVGCDRRFKREDQEEHTTQTFQKHLTLTAAATIKMNQQLQQMLQEQETMHHAEEQKLEQKLLKQEQEILEQDSKHHVEVQKLEQKILEQDSKHHADVQKLEQKILEQDSKHHEEVQKLEQKFQELEKMFKNMLHELQEQAKRIVQLQDQNEVAVKGIKEVFVLKRTFVMERFNEEKAKDKPDDWKSPGMYTHWRGYKFCLGVNANGVGSSHGKAMCVGLWAMQGEYDHELKWPAQASFTIELINQNEGENIKYTSKTISWNKPDEACKWEHHFGRKYYLHPAFLEHSKVKDFLYKDTLYFNITDITLL